MEFGLKRTNKVENLSSLQGPRGRQIKREGEGIGLPTSESKRTKRNPLTSFQNILSNRPTIRLKKNLVQGASDRAKRSGEHTDKPAPQGKNVPLRNRDGESRGDQENVDPKSRIPVSKERKPLFVNPFTKKRQSVVPPADPVPLGQKQVPTGQKQAPTGQKQAPTGQKQAPTGQKQAPTGQKQAPTGQKQVPMGQKQNVVKIRVPQEENNNPGVRATSHLVLQGPHAEVSRRVALANSQTVTNHLSNLAAINTCKDVSLCHLAAPEMKRKPLGVVSQTGTYSDSSSSSTTSQPMMALGVSSRMLPPGVLNQSLNSSFLQTFSKMNTIDQRATNKENPQGGPYLTVSNRSALQTTRVSDPATSHLFHIPQTLELSCTPDKNDVIMLSPHSQLSDPLIDLDCIGSQYLLCPEYTPGVFLYLRSVETRFMPGVTYLTKQPDINEGMRSILVDWLVEVSTEYKLHVQTLFLSINYIDRFLSCMSVSRTKLQLVGTCCMYIASKFEEIYPPELSEFAFITDDTYSKKQVIRMEALVLKALEFNLLAPTAHLFAERFIKAVTPSSKKMEHLVSYLCELALLSDNITLSYRPSMVAAAAISLSLETLGLSKWSLSLTRHTGYDWTEIQSCRTLLHLQFYSAPNLTQQAIQVKYRSADFLNVSGLSLPLKRAS